MFELVRALNSAIDAGELGAGDVPAIRAGVRRVRPGARRAQSCGSAEDEQPPVPVEEIERLIEERHAARRRRDFAAADRIRDDLAARGVLLEDSAGRARAGSGSRAACAGPPELMQ